MKRLLFLAFVLCVCSTRCLADVCTAMPSCEDLGYSKDPDPACGPFEQNSQRYLQCPYDSSYRKCINYSCESMGFSRDTLDNPKSAWCQEDAIITCLFDKEKDKEQRSTLCAEYLPRCTALPCNEITPPDNAKCSSECYARTEDCNIDLQPTCIDWVCEEGYHCAKEETVDGVTVTKAVSCRDSSKTKCEENCPKESCNDAIVLPEHATCDTPCTIQHADCSIVEGANLCKFWHCDEGFQQVGNRCESPTTCTETTCSIKEPPLNAHGITPCTPMSSNCNSGQTVFTDWACNTGYHCAKKEEVNGKTTITALDLAEGDTCSAKNGNSCQIDCHIQTCSAEVTVPEQNAKCTQKCTTQDINCETNEICVAWECNSGYKKVQTQAGFECQAITCTQSQAECGSGAVAVTPPDNAKCQSACVRTSDDCSTVEICTNWECINGYHCANANGQAVSCSSSEKASCEKDCYNVCDPNIYKYYDYDDDNGVIHKNIPDHSEVAGVSCIPQDSDCNEGIELYKGFDCETNYHKNADGTKCEPDLKKPSNEEFATKNCTEGYTCQCAEVTIPPHAHETSNCVAVDSLGIKSLSVPTAFACNQDYHEIKDTNGVVVGCEEDYKGPICQAADVAITGENASQAYCASPCKPVSKDGTVGAEVCEFYACNYGYDKITTKDENDNIIKVECLKSTDTNVVCIPRSCPGKIDLATAVIKNTDGKTHAEGINMCSEITKTGNECSAPVQVPTDFICESGYHCAKATVNNNGTVTDVEPVDCSNSEKNYCDKNVDNTVSCVRPRLPENAVWKNLDDMTEEEKKTQACTPVFPDGSTGNTVSMVWLCQTPDEGDYFEDSIGRKYQYVLNQSKTGCDKVYEELGTNCTAAVLPKNKSGSTAAGAKYDLTSECLKQDATGLQTRVYTKWVCMDGFSQACVYATNITNNNEVIHQEDEPVLDDTGNLVTECGDKQKLSCVQKANSTCNSPLSKPNNAVESNWCVPVTNGISGDPVLTEWVCQSGYHCAKKKNDGTFEHITLDAGQSCNTNGGDSCVATCYSSNSNCDTEHYPYTATNVPEGTEVDTSKESCTYQDWTCDETKKVTRYIAFRCKNQYEKWNETTQKCESQACPAPQNACSDTAEPVTTPSDLTGVNLTQCNKNIATVEPCSDKVEKITTAWTCGTGYHCVDTSNKYVACTDESKAKCRLDCPVATFTEGTKPECYDSTGTTKETCTPVCKEQKLPTNAHCDSLDSVCTLYGCPGGYHPVNSDNTTKCIKDCEPKTCYATIMPTTGHAHKLTDAEHTCCPQNATCSNSSSDCVSTAWECDSGYHQINNGCYKDYTDNTETCNETTYPYKRYGDNLPEFSHVAEADYCVPTTINGPTDEALYKDWTCNDGYHCVKKVGGKKTYVECTDTGKEKECVVDCQDTVASICTASRYPYFETNDKTRPTRSHVIKGEDQSCVPTHKTCLTETERFKDWECDAGYISVDSTGKEVDNTSKEKADCVCDEKNSLFDTALRCTKVSNGFACHLLTDATQAGYGCYTYSASTSPCIAGYYKSDMTILGQDPTTGANIIGNGCMTNTCHEYAKISENSDYPDYDNKVASDMVEYNENMDLTPYNHNRYYTQDYDYYLVNDQTCEVKKYEDAINPIYPATSDNDYYRRESTVGNYERVCKVFDEAVPFPKAISSLIADDEGKISTYTEQICSEEKNQDCADIRCDATEMYLYDPHLYNSAGSAYDGYHCRYLADGESCAYDDPHACFSARHFHHRAPYKCEMHGVHEICETDADGCYTDDDGHRICGREADIKAETADGSLKTVMRCVESTNECQNLMTCEEYENQYGTWATNEFVPYKIGRKVDEPLCRTSTSESECVIQYAYSGCMPGFIDFSGCSGGKLDCRMSRIWPVQFKIQYSFSRRGFFMYKLFYKCHVPNLSYTYAKGNDRLYRFGKYDQIKFTLRTSLGEAAPSGTSIPNRTFYVSCSENDNQYHEVGCSYDNDNNCANPGVPGRDGHWFTYDTNINYYSTFSPTITLHSVYESEWNACQYNTTYANAKGVVIRSGTVGKNNVPAYTAGTEPQWSNWEDQEVWDYIKSREQYVDGTKYWANYAVITPQEDLVKKYTITGFPYKAYDNTNTVIGTLGDGTWPNYPVISIDGTTQIGTTKLSDYDDSFVIKNSDGQTVGYYAPEVFTEEFNFGVVYPSQDIATEYLGAISGYGSNAYREPLDGYCITDMCQKKALNAKIGTPLINPDGSSRLIFDPTIWNVYVPTEGESYDYSGEEISGETVLSSDSCPDSCSTSQFPYQSGPGRYFAANEVNRCSSHYDRMTESYNEQCYDYYGTCRCDFDAGYVDKGYPSIRLNSNGYYADSSYTSTCDCHPKQATFKFFVKSGYDGTHYILSYDCETMSSSTVSIQVEASAKLKDNITGTNVVPFFPTSSTNTLTCKHVNQYSDTLSTLRQTCSLARKYTTGNPLTDCSGQSGEGFGTLVGFQIPDGGSDIVFRVKSVTVGTTIAGSDVTYDAQHIGLAAGGFGTYENGVEPTMHGVTQKNSFNFNTGGSSTINQKRMEMVVWGD